MKAEQVKSEYETRAEEFLTRHGVKFMVVPVGTACPRRCDGKHMHGYQYKVTFTRACRKPFVTDFWNSFADTQRPARGWETADRIDPLTRKPMTRHSPTSAPLPTAYDVLSCLTHSDPGTHAEFCADFGCDTDSRKGLDTYLAVVEEWAKVRAMFGDCLDELQEIN